MPAFNKLYAPSTFKFNPQAFKEHGALLVVEIHIPIVLENVLKIQNKPIPGPKKGVALIDTGATNTCVDHNVISGLGVKSVGVINSGTAGGSAQMNLFPARLKFPNENLNLEFTSCAGVSLDGQTAMGLPIIALLGRDVLSNFILIYNGPAGMYTITT